MDNGMDWAECRKGEARTTSKGSIKTPQATAAQKTMEPVVLIVSTVFRGN